MLTDRSRIFPPTRKPKSLCTRASTIPVKVLLLEPAACASKISTVGDCRRGSFAADLEHPFAIKVNVNPPASRPMVLFFNEVCIAHGAWWCSTIHRPGEGCLVQPARRRPDEDRHCFVCQSRHDAHAP